MGMQFDATINRLRENVGEFFQSSLESLAAQKAITSDGDVPAVEVSVNSLVEEAAEWVGNFIQGEKSDEVGGHFATDRRNSDSFSSKPPQPGKSSSPEKAVEEKRERGFREGKAESLPSHPEVVGKGKDLSSALPPLASSSIPDKLYDILLTISRFAEGLHQTITGKPFGHEISVADAEQLVAAMARDALNEEKRAAPHKLSDLGVTSSSSHISRLFRTSLEPHLYGKSNEEMAWRMLYALAFGTDAVGKLSGSERDALWMPLRALQAATQLLMQTWCLTTPHQEGQWHTLRALDIFLFRTLPHMDAFSTHDIVARLSHVTQSGAVGGKKSSSIAAALCQPLSFTMAAMNVLKTLPVLSTPIFAVPFLLLWDETRHEFRKWLYDTISRRAVDDISLDSISDENLRELDRLVFGATSLLQV